ncbi:neuroguidin [Narcine bancroftii]|uniref:neuroguidin n=1 Tax=Narcine bancroftii TaxID=1343680 RepID=UPI0038319B6E
MEAALRALCGELSAVTAHVRRALQVSVENPSTQGLSILYLKNHLLGMYLSDLTYVILRKLMGQSLRDEPTVLRLVEIRTVLEKIRPIEHKLRYQIDKLVKATLTGTLSDRNPLSFKANPGNLISKLDEAKEEDEEEEEEEEEQKPSRKEASHTSKKVYVPPRLVPVHYELEETAEQRESRALERAKRRALSSSLVRELQEQYGQGPEEVQEGQQYHSLHQDRQEAHRVQYEESMMVRLTVPRKERSRKSRALAMTSQLGSLTHFRSISALTGDMDLGRAAKRRKLTPKGKKRGKKGFRRR